MPKPIKRKKPSVDKVKSLVPKSNFKMPIRERQEYVAAVRLNVAREELTYVVDTFLAEVVKVDLLRKARSIIQVEIDRLYAKLEGLETR